MKHRSAPEIRRLAYSVNELAEILGICESNAWKLVRKGDVESFKNGKSRRITHRAIEDYLARKEAEARKARKAA